MLGSAVFLLKNNNCIIKAIQVDAKLEGKSEE